MYPTEKEDKIAVKSRILITCSKGITPFLAAEVLQSGFPILSQSIAGIATEGTIADTYSLNLLLRTAHRILFLLREFPAHHADDLYRSVYEIPWERFISPDEYVCVTSSVDNPSIRDTRFANVKCKDAIVDRIREMAGRRPDSGPDRDRVVINLYWKGNDCSLHIDTTGEPLTRRGYRKIPMMAPMQETLAAAVIMASGWNGRGHLINPMCGSGTLAIEAALLGLNRPAAVLRNNFGFMHLKGFDAGSWAEIRAEAKRRAKGRLTHRIIATDVSEEAIDAAQRNAPPASR